MEININDVKTSANKNRKAMKTLLVVLAILIAGAVACVFIILGMVKDDSSGSLFLDPRDDDQIIIEDSGTDDNQLPISGPIEYNGKTYVKNGDIVNLLFLGIDTNEERSEQNMGYRSDMVLVCAVDVNAKTATLISIPRDTYTTVYKIDRSDGSVTDIIQQRINAAFAFGGGASHYSYQNAYTCVEMFLQRECVLEEPLDFTLDIPVYLYAGIDMDGITEVASAVGGIDITLDYDIPDVGSKGETVNLTGYKAEMYLRDRHNTAGADLGRASRQRIFMLTLAKKIKSMNAVDIILSLRDELSAYVDYNLSTDQMLDFAKVLMNVDIDAIQQYTIEGASATSGTSYFYHDEAATLELLLDIYYEEEN